MGEKQNTNIEKNEKVQENITNVSTNEVKIEDYSNNQKDHFEPQSEENNRRNNNNLLVIILAILVLILAGVVTYLILASKKEQQPVSKVAPTLVLIGENSITLTEGEAYVDPGYQANDDKDGDITGKVVIEGTVNSEKAGFYTILYSVTDSDSLTSSLTRKVTVVSKETTLTLELKGEEIAVINKDETYVEPGYIAKDTKEGDLSSNVVITGKVNSNVAGKYTLTYSVTNSATEVATATRTIIVVTPIKELSINDQLVKKLYSIVNYYSGTLNNHQTKKITYKELKKEAMLAAAFYSCDNDSEMTNKELTDCLKKMYNVTNISIPTTTKVLFDQTDITYDNATKKWQNGNKGLTLDTSLLSAAIQDGDYIYIYDKYVEEKNTNLNVEQGGTFDNCDSEGVIKYAYADSELKIKIGETYCYPPSDNNLYSILNETIYEDVSVPYYKHTFKKYNDNNDYYFVSSEIVK